VCRAGCVRSLTLAVVVVVVVVVVTPPTSSFLSCSEHGAHVTNWTVGGRDVLFLSSKAVLDGSKAIRGGIPLCFPWFGPSTHPDSSLQHGFARVSNWRCVDEQQDGRGLTMELKDSDVDPALLAGYSDSKFVVRYSVKILDGSSLGLEMVVKNVGDVPLPFSLAFHSYFRVAAASVEVRLNATGVRFLDQLSGSEGVNAGGVVEGFGDREIDLVCYGVTNPIDIVTNEGEKRAKSKGTEGGASANATTVVTIDASDGLRDAVVWNPHVAKSKAMADFGDEEYREMVCVESARVETPVVVRAGGEWACSLRLRVFR